MNKIRNTIDYLRKCQQARKHGYPVYLKTDPAWLVNVAINRRAGWPESSVFFASCQPVNEQYPKRADENLSQLAARVNTPNLVIRAQEIPKRYRIRLASRITED